MKKNLIYLLLSVFSTVSALSQSFETERTKQLYDALTGNQQNNVVKALDRVSSTIIPADELYKNAYIKIKKNREGEISFLGVNLLCEEFIEPKYIDAYRFLEALVLAAFLNKQEIFFFENKEVQVKLEGKKILPDSEQVKSFIANIENCDFNFNYNQHKYVFVWTSEKKTTLSFEFKADLSMLKGMGKPEIEKEFIRDLNNYKFTPAAQNSFLNERVYELPSGLYLWKGQPFGSDDFRSDIYFENANNAFVPVFSKKFPVESLSNLFIAENKNQLTIQTTLIGYAGKQELIVKDLNTLNAFLKKDTKAFFGLAENKNGHMKATIVYYNEVYSYVHMLTVEANETLFDSQAKTSLKANLYIYIPRLDLIENIDKRKSTLRTTK